jgi:hypothetical protein
MHYSKEKRDRVWKKNDDLGEHTERPPFFEVA